MSPIYKERIISLSKRCSTAIPILMCWICIYLTEVSILFGVFAFIIAVVFTVWLDIRELLQKCKSGKNIFSEWAKDLLCSAILFVPIQVLSVFIANFLMRIILPYAGMGDGISYIFPVVLVFMALLISIYKLFVLLISGIRLKLAQRGSKENNPPKQ